MFNIYRNGLICLIVVVCSIESSKNWSNDKHAIKWYQNAQENIQKILHRKLNHKVAKNSILFLGDGKLKIKKKTSLAFTYCVIFCFIIIKAWELRQVRR
jgi:hypothetical protein